MVLGAATGQAVLGKEAKNKALLWGAVAGTIPDMDIIPRLFSDTVTGLEIHRGFSHSLLFAIAGPLLFGPLVAVIHNKLKISWQKWAQLFFWGILTHLMLDNFTTWGTQVFYPHEHRVAWRTIFVIDPLYTLPFFTLVVTVLFFKDHKKRQMFNYLAIGISSFYLLITIVNKNVANNVFEKETGRQGIVYNRFETNPTPFNSILWYANIETDSGFYVGNYSLLDTDSKIEFVFFPKNYHLLENYQQNNNLQRLLKLTRGFYTVKKLNNRILINDLRFGAADIIHSEKSEFAFSYLLHTDENDSSQITSIEWLRAGSEVRTSKIEEYLQRLRGIKP